MSDVDWVQEFFPLVLPARWRIIDHTENGRAYLNLRTDCTVIASGGIYAGKRWFHVSIAHPHRLPEWRELTEVKELFIGKDRMAVQIFPSHDRWVNIHKNCLHLWHCVDGLEIPDFAAEGEAVFGFKSI